MSLPRTAPEPVVQEPEINYPESESSQRLALGVWVQQELCWDNGWHRLGRFCVITTVISEHTLLLGICLQWYLLLVLSTLGLMLEVFSARSTASMAEFNKDDRVLSWCNQLVARNLRSLPHLSFSQLHLLVASRTVSSVSVGSRLSRRHSRGKAIVQVHWSPQCVQR